jgi:biopolymer transport protein ExbD
MALRKRRYGSPAEEDPGLDMSSLIDVSFLLLIYFLVTSTLNPKEADLGMTLPTTDISNPSDVEVDQLTIKVEDSGLITVNDTPLDSDPTVREVPLLFDNLKQYVTTAKMLGSKPVVVIDAGDQSKSQRFIDVLNTLAHEEIDIKNVTLTGFKPE